MIINNKTYYINDTILLNGRKAVLKNVESIANVDIYYVQYFDEENIIGIIDVELEEMLD